MKEEKDIAIILALIIIAAAIHFYGVPFSLYAGSASGNRFAYFLTYTYPSISLAPSTISVSYTYHNPYGSSSQAQTYTATCNTNTNYVSFETGMTELDAPVNSYTSSPIQGYYYYHNGTATTCEISLPASNYNQTNGTITYQASGPSGTSNVYIAHITVSSIYSQNQNNVLLFTIPIGSSTGSSTVTVSTTISSTTTIASTSIASTTIASTSSSSSLTTTTINGSKSSTTTTTTTATTSTTTTTIAGSGTSNGTLSGTNGSQNNSTNSNGTGEVFAIVIIIVIGMIAYDLFLRTKRGY